MIKVVLLDIDNTLLDFDAGVQRAVEDGFKVFGLGQYDDSVFRSFQQVNTSMWWEIEQGALTYEELLKERWNRIFSVLGIQFDGRTFEKYFRKCLFDSAIPVDGAIDILAYLKDRYTLCIASNGPYEQQINRLKKGNMHSFFSEFFISEKIGVSKPSRSFFTYCLNELNKDSAYKDGCKILPTEVVMIGDSLTSDIAGAGDFGFKTCYFDRSCGNTADTYTADYVICSLRDIKSFL